MIKKIILILITILWMTSIFMFSNQKSEKSTEKSQSIVTHTIVKIYKIFNSDASEETIQNIIDTWDVPIRKTAHFIEYFILGVLVFLTLREFGNKNIYYAILICFLYACSDEVHQIFVPGRDGNFVDVMLDTFGSTTSILLLNKLKERKK